MKKIIIAVAFALACSAPAMAEGFPNLYCTHCQR